MRTHAARGDELASLARMGTGALHRPLNRAPLYWPLSLICELQICSSLLVLDPGSERIVQGQGGLVMVMIGCRPCLVFGGQHANSVMTWEGE